MSEDHCAEHSGLVVLVSNFIEQVHEIKKKQASISLRVWLILLGLSAILGEKIPWGKFF